MKVEREGEEEMEYESRKKTVVREETEEGGEGGGGGEKIEKPEEQ